MDNLELDLEALLEDLYSQLDMKTREVTMGRARERALQAKLDALETKEDE